MKIKQFAITGLFELYNHTLDFESRNNEFPSNDGASVIMIYGRNGIGKTTILRMIEGLMTLNFDIFRNCQFKNAYLSFSNGYTISVERHISNTERNLDCLLVKYREFEIKLNPKGKGALSPEEKEIENKLIKLYETDLNKFSYEFIDTERLIRKNIKDEMQFELDNSKGKIVKRNQSDTYYLLNKVKGFIRDSQVNFANYFSKSEPDLFDKILKNLENQNKINAKELLGRINFLEYSEKEYRIDEIGLAKEKWDRIKLEAIIKKSSNDQNKLTIIASYIEVLESRNLERMSLAERLITFEKLLNEFLSDKSISIKNEGFEIYSKNKNQDSLNEIQLSTGEYHLLYLTSLALCTKVKGTIIAIDEPEMSMHIIWQRDLVKTLVKISSKASPQIIFATHSPDIAANYPNSLKTVMYDADRS